MATHQHTPFDQQRPIPGVKNIIAVASGKGGVGKSTVATNLALALSKKFKVGLLDADIYGPSVPRMMGTLNQKPIINNQQRIEPIQRFGLKMMSIGYIVDEASAVVWRGPMLFKALDQFLRDVDWGELDFLVIDLPPGTGDIQLSLAQKIPVAGAVVVSTPQNVALVDVKKAIDMFQRVNVPILGIVENMAYMVNPATGEKIQLFPKGELEGYAKEKNFKILSHIPFHPQVGMSCEMGFPVAEFQPQSAEAQEFFKLADITAQLVLKTADLQI